MTNNGGTSERMEGPDHLQSAEKKMHSYYNFILELRALFL